MIRRKYARPRAGFGGWASGESVLCLLATDAHGVPLVDDGRHFAAFVQKVLFTSERDQYHATEEQNKNNNQIDVFRW
jgi:hypothetical protein